MNAYHDESSLANGAEPGFRLPVAFEGKALLFDGRLLPFGFTYRVEMLVDGLSLYFERDEERAWRVIVPEGVAERKLPRPELLRAVADALDAAAG